MAGWLILILLGPQLAFIAVNDLRNWKITNASNLGLLATFLVVAVIGFPTGKLIAHLAFAAIMFALLLFPFAKGWLGGGDVKFLGVAFLWIGPGCVLPFSVCLLVGLLLYMAIARFRLVPVERVKTHHRIPFGPIGAAALALSLVICR